MYGQHLLSFPFLHTFWQTYSMTSAPALFTQSMSKTFARGIHRTSGSSSRLMFTVGGANCARHDTASPKSSSSSSDVRSIFRSSAPETADSPVFLWRATITAFPLQTFHNKRKKRRTYSRKLSSFRKTKALNLITILEHQWTTIIHPPSPPTTSTTTTNNNVLSSAVTILPSQKQEDSKSKPSGDLVDFQ